MPRPPKSMPVRRSSRLNVRIPVRISGTSPDGKPFTEDTHILTVSRFGARLTSTLPLKLGTQIKVKPKQGNQSAVFRVVWLGSADSPRAGHVGIEYVKVSNLLGISFPD